MEGCPAIPPHCQISQLLSKEIHSQRNREISWHLHNNFHCLPSKNVVDLDWISLRKIPK